MKRVGHHDRRAKDFYSEAQQPLGKKKKNIFSLKKEEKRNWQPSVRRESPASWPYFTSKPSIHLPVLRKLGKKGKLGKKEKEKKKKGKKRKRMKFTRPVDVYFSGDYPPLSLSSERDKKREPKRKKGEGRKKKAQFSHGTCNCILSTATPYPVTVQRKGTKEKERIHLRKKGEG